MFLVLLMYALFASVFTVGKLGLEASQPYFLTGVRMLLAGVVLLGWQAFKNPASCYTPVRVWPLLILVAIFNVFITNAFEFWGLQYMLSSKTCLIYSLSPFAAVFLSYLFLGETMSSMKWLGMLIGIAGFIPLFAMPWLGEGAEVQSNMESWAEAALTISAITAVIGWIFVKKLTHEKHYPGIMVNAVSFILGAFFCFIVSAFTEKWDPFPVSHWEGFWIAVLYIALVHNVICYNIYAYSLNRFSVTFMAFAGLSNPLFTAIYGWYFLAEPLTLPFFIAIFGAAIGLGLFYREEQRTSLATFASCVIILFSLTSCGPSPQMPSTHWEKLSDRTGRPLYQVSVPNEWEKIDLSSSANLLTDTTLAIASWKVGDIKITVHTFPASSMEERIASQVQIARWLKQLKGLDEASIHVVPVGHGGYLGLEMEAYGENEGTIARSMQLAPEHFLNLASHFPSDNHIKADFTIKATGPKESIASQRENILLFAQSFEMIDEISK